MKILVVLTSHDQLGDTGQKTGFWLEELAAPYYVLKDAGGQLVFASPKGGQVPLDPKSEQQDMQTAATERFNKDKQALKLLANTKRLVNIKPNQFDAIFYPGGHGPLWDLVNDKHSIALIKAFYQAGKPVAAVCHGPAVFKNSKLDDGQYLVSGKKLTGFSNSEEEAVQLTKVVPFLLEDMLKAQGAIYTKAADWTPYLVMDENLISGQNPASSGLVARALLNRLQAKKKG